VILPSRHSRVLSSADYRFYRHNKSNRRF